MKCLLINPKFEHSLNEDIKLPPLGLAYVAGALRASGCGDVRILDAALSRNPLADIEQTTRDYAPNIVGITATSPLMKAALQAAGLVKGVDRRIATAIGGVHPTLFSEDVAGREGIDYVVFGEGERTMVELVRCVEQGRPPDGVQGVAFRRNGAVVVNPGRALVQNLDDLPFPAYDLLAVRKYSAPQVSRTPCISMCTSRGCPYRCIFCEAPTIFGRKYRAYSPQRILEEILYLTGELQVREILFKDSEFTFDTARVEGLCDLLIQRNVKVAWSCNGRVGNVTLPLLRKMRRAGCRLVAYGVESGDQRILDTLRKQITIPDILETFEMSRAAGLKTVANFMIGNPGEDNESVENTAALARRLRCDYAAVSFLIPLPGSELHRMARENNWLLDNYDPMDIRGDTCVMNATALTVEQLHEAYNKVVKSFYLRPAYIGRRLLTLSPHQWKMNFKWFLKILAR